MSLSTSVKGIFSDTYLVKGVSQAVGFQPEEISKMNVSVHEDNAAATIITNMEPPIITPRKKRLLY